MRCRRQARKQPSEATSTIPIVFVSVSDPVESGIVVSLARPGGNLTGVSNFLPATTGKLLDLLRQTTPAHLALQCCTIQAILERYLSCRSCGQQRVGLSAIVEPVEVQESADFERAFANIEQLHSDGLVVLQDGVTGGSAKLIIEFANKSRLPAIYQIREYAEAGGLISYGLNFCEHFKRAASYADRILKERNQPTCRLNCRPSLSCS